MNWPLLLVVLAIIAVVEGLSYFAYKCSKKAREQERDEMNAQCDDIEQRNNAVEKQVFELLNQLDTLPEEHRARIARDLNKILESTGKTKDDVKRIRAELNAEGGPK